MIFSWQRAGTDSTTTQESTFETAGVNIYESSSTFTYQHAKFWMADGAHSLVKLRHRFWLS